MYILILDIQLSINLLYSILDRIYGENSFFGVSYWAPRINSSTVLCQTRDHLLSKTFHQAKHFGKTPNNIHTGNEPYLLCTCGNFPPPLLNPVLFTSIRNGVSHETLKGEGHPTPHKQWIPNVRGRMLQKNLNAFKPVYRQRYRTPLLFLSQQCSCAISDPSNPVIEELWLQG